MPTETYHIPALLPETLEALDLHPDGTYVDATFGGGGHSRAILDRLGPQGRLLSLDQDDEAVANAFSDPRFTMVHGNFRFLRNYLRYYRHDSVDGILADLGVSFHHFDDADRGFSFRYDGPLDMRMNRRARITAARIIADSSEEELERLRASHGELKQARRMAPGHSRRPERSTGRHRRTAARSDPTADQPASGEERARTAVPGPAHRGQRRDPRTARIPAAGTPVAPPGGRLAVITYHSLEDRLVKNFMRTGNLNGDETKDFFGRNLSPMKLITSKPIVPGDDEVQRNPRSRSAKLRVAVKL